MNYAYQLKYYCPKLLAQTILPVGPPYTVKFVLWLTQH